MKNIIDKKEIEFLFTEMIKANIHIIIEKNCGYKFLISINENSFLNDLYEQVRRFYIHVNRNDIILYLNNNYYKCIHCDYKKNDRVINKKDIIPDSKLLIKDYIFNKNIKPYIKYPNDIMYKFYLNMK